MSISKCCKFALVSAVFFRRHAFNVVSGQEKTQTRGTKRETPRQLGQACAGRESSVTEHSINSARKRFPIKRRQRRFS